MKSGKFLNPPLDWPPGKPWKSPPIGGYLTHTARLDPRAGQQNVYSWEYRSKTQIIPMLPERFGMYIPQLPLSVLPHEYVEVARWMLRCDYYVRMYELESQGAALPTPLMPVAKTQDQVDAEIREEFRQNGWVLNHSMLRKARTEARRKYEFDLAQALMRRSFASAHQDARRPSPETIRKYHTPHIRSRIVNLLVSGCWIEQPCAMYPEGSDAWECVDTMNARMRAYPMGRNSHLKFSADPGTPCGSGRKQS